MWTMMIGSCMCLRTPFTHETRSCAPLHDRQDASMSLTAKDKKIKQFREPVLGLAFPPALDALTYLSPPGTRRPREETADAGTMSADNPYGICATLRLGIVICQPHARA